MHATLFTIHLHIKKLFSIEIHTVYVYLYRFLFRCFIRFSCCKCTIKCTAPAKLLQDSYSDQGMCKKERERPTNRTKQNRIGESQCIVTTETNKRRRREKTHANRAIIIEKSEKNKTTTHRRAIDFIYFYAMQIKSFILHVICTIFVALMMHLHFLAGWLFFASTVFFYFRSRLLFLSLIRFNNIVTLAMYNVFLFFFYINKCRFEQQCKVKKI